MKISTFKILLVRIEPNYGERFHKGISAVHFLKAYLEGYYKAKRPIEIEIVELNSCWPHAKDLDFNWILDRQPDLVGFSCYCWNFNIVVTISKTLKELQPGLKIVAGGPEITFRAEELLEAHPGIDIVVRGEGEITFYELVERLANGNNDLHDLPGITFRQGQKIVTNQNRPLLTNLDLIPSPILEGVVDLSKTDGEVMIETVRGCPYQCTYCLYTKGLTNVRAYSMKRIEVEVRYLCLDPKIRVIWFADPTFDANEKRALKIMDLILRVNPKQRVAFELRAEILTPQILDRLRRLNVEDVAVGLQTINPQTLKRLRRSFNKEKFQTNLLKLADVLNHKKSTIFIDIIYGLPGDCFEDYKQTIDFVLKMGGVVFYQPLRVFQGTVIAKESRKYGIRYQRDIPHNILYCDSFTLEDMKKAYQLNAGLDFYQSGIKPLKKAIDILINDLSLSPGTIFKLIGEILWNKGLRNYFRVSNASPSDIPADWRIQDFLGVLEYIRSLTPNPSAKILQLRDLLKKKVQSKKNNKSGYYHAAL